MRTFQLNRKQDISGVSGTGIVADGVIFPNGRVALCWRGEISSTVLYDKIEDVEKIHGHGGATEIQYIDDPDYNCECGDSQCICWTR
jgi:hypothetical protein